jgi:hypothetical protein
MRAVCCETCRDPTARWKFSLARNINLTIYSDGTFEFDALPTMETEGLGNSNSLELCIADEVYCGVPESAGCSVVESFRNDG